MLKQEFNIDALCIIHRLFHETDWYPTILSLAGADIPDGLDGVDQSAMLLDGADSARDELVMNLDQYTPCLFGRGAIRYYNLLAINVSKF